MAETALITGAAVRLGAAMAERLATDGMAVAIHYRSSADAAEALARKIAEAGGTARTFQADLAEEGAAAALWNDVAGAMGPPGLLVNNAAMFAKDEADSFTAVGLARQMAVNLTAPAVLSRKLYEAATAAGDDGTDRLIVNMLDAKLFQINPDFFTYTLSKHALLGATKTMAIAFAPRVRVMGIAPSVALISGKQSEETFQRSKALTLLRRGPDAADVVRALVFARESRAMTGETLVLDGGQKLMNLPHDVAFYVANGIL